MSASPETVNSSAAEFLAYLDGLIEHWRPQTVRKQDRSRQREREIIDAAIKVFARSGLASARITDIASEANIAMSSLYQYISSKEDLFEVVPTTHMQSFFEEFRSILDGYSTAFDYLWHFLYHSAIFAKKNNEWAMVLYLEIWPSVTMKNGSANHIFNDYTRILLHILDLGEKQGEWAKDRNHYETANILVGALNQTIVMWLLSQRPRNLERATAMMIDRLLDALLVRTPKSVNFASQ